MVHNVVDLLTAIGVLMGLKLSTRKSETFPYGLYKLENVIAVVLAGMIFFTADVEDFRRSSAARSAPRLRVSRSALVCPASTEDPGGIRSDFLHL
jgi:hypothetical protein